MKVKSEEITQWFADWVRLNFSIRDSIYSKNHRYNNWVKAVSELIPENKGEINSQIKEFLEIHMKITYN